MGKEMESGDADMSAVGTLVWVRRPNGSWWPGRVVPPQEVPDSCPPPPRTPSAIPILLLGNRDGAIFVEWCNLERCKRVKPFRCGERELEDCIRKAQEQRQQHAARRIHRTNTAGSCTRYARKEDAVLQALDIERARLPPRSTSRATTTTTTTNPASAPAAAVQPLSRKRRTPNDCEDDAPPQRMKDLTDIVASAPPKFVDLNQHLPTTSQMKRSKQSHHHHDSSAAASPPTTFADLNRHLPSTGQMKRSKQSYHHHDFQDNQPCGVPRKRDRSRPLSELCNGSDNAWNNNNGLKQDPSGRRPADQRFMRAASSLDTVMVRTRSRRAVAPVKMEPVDDAFPCGGDGPVVDAHLAATSVFKADHLYVHQPCASTKAPTRECTKRTFNCSKDGGIPSQCDSRNYKKKTTSSVAHEGGNRIKIEPGCEHPNGKVATHKAASNGVVLLEKRVEKTTTTKAPTRECTKRALNCSKDGGIPSQCDSRNDKKKTTSSVAHEGGKRIKIEPGCEYPNGKVATHKAASNRNGAILLEKRVEKTTTAAAHKAAAPDAYKDLAMIPNGLNRVGEVGLQRHSERKCKLEEPSETISNCTERENVPAPSVVFEPLHQVLPPQQRDPVVGRCLAAVEPVNTLQLNSHSIYNVEVSAQGAGSSSNSKGGRVPLVSLMSRSSRRPVVGYPVSVEVLDDTAPRPPAAIIPDDHPSTSNSTANRPMKEEEEPTAVAPRRAMPPSSSSHRAAPATRAKAKSRKKASEDDESWRPHTKNSYHLAAASSSPRKMRRLLSFASGQSGGDRRPAVRAAVGVLCRGRGPALACVPLRLVFSRIHEALTHSGR